MQDAFYTLHKIVQSELPDAPGTMVYRAMARAARELCDKSHCWKSPVTLADMVMGVNTVSLPLPNGADLIGIEYLIFNNILELTQTTERELNAAYPNWRSVYGDPIQFIPQPQLDQVTLFPMPNRNLAASLTYRLVLKPQADVTTLDEWLCEQFSETLQHGTLSILFRMAGRTWFSADLTAMHRRMFMMGVYDARDKTTREYATQSLYVVPGGEI